MTKSAGIALVFIILTGCASNEFDLATDYAALSAVKSIYVSDFGDDDGSNLVREKLLVRLINSRRLSHERLVPLI